MNGSLLAARVATAALAAATGGLIGFVLTFTHRQYQLDLAGIPVPLGLLGGLAIIAALLAGLRLAFGDRAAPFAAAAGVLAAIAVLGIPLPSGSTVYAGDALDYVWVLAPAVIAAIVVGWPDPRRRSSGGSPS